MGNELRALFMKDNDGRGKSGFVFLLAKIDSRPSFGD